MLYPSNHSYEQFGTFCHQYNGNDRVSFEDQKVTSGIFEDLNFRARNVFHSSGALSHCSVYTPNEQSLQEKYTENSGFSDCSDEQENWRNSCNRATWAYKSFSNPNFHKTHTQGQTQETVEHAEVTSNGFQNSLEHIEHNQWSECTTIGDHHRRHYQEQCNADTRDTRIKDHFRRHNHGSCPSTNVTWANFGVSRDISTRDGYFEAVSDDHCRFRHFRADHLSEIQFENSVPHAPSQWKSFSADGSKKKKKRYRPFAAQRERERLAVMNSALRKLKMCLPLEESEQKLSKKEILQTAILYIKYLSKTLDQESVEETLNLNKHNYLLKFPSWSEETTSSS